MDTGYLMSRTNSFVSVKTASLLLSTIVSVTFILGMKRPSINTALAPIISVQKSMLERPDEAISPMQTSPRSLIIARLSWHFCRRSWKTYARPLIRAVTIFLPGMALAPWHLTHSKLMVLIGIILAILGTFPDMR